MDQVIELSMDISDNDYRFLNSNQVRFLLCSNVISMFYESFGLTQNCGNFYKDANQAFFRYMALDHQVFANQIEVWDLSSILKGQKINILEFSR